MSSRLKDHLHFRFLDKKINLILIISFIIIILLQFYFYYSDWIQTHFYNFSKFIKDNNTIISLFISIIPISSIILSLFPYNKDKKNTPIFNGQIEKTTIFAGLVTQNKIENEEVILVKNRPCDQNDFEKKPMIIDRKTQCENIQQHIISLQNKAKEKKLNCLFLTGSSGSGKSILIKNFLYKKLEKSYKCHLIKNNYHDDDIIYRTLFNKYDIIIMDQFEESLDNEQIYKCIKKLVMNSNKPILFIFAFPKDFFDKIHLKIINTFSNGNYDTDIINSTTYFLQYDKHDISQLKILINSFVGSGCDILACLNDCKETFRRSQNFSSVVDYSKYPLTAIFLCSILTRVELGTSPLVEFSILSYIYELFSEEINLNLKEYINNTDKVIELYLNNWVNKFPNKETAKIILYLLSDQKIYDTNDLKFVTFENENCFNDNLEYYLNITKAIKSNTFIRIINTYNGFKKGATTIHDYAGIKINEYCFKNLSNEIRQNVDNYRKSMSYNPKYKIANAESKNKQIIERRYENFHNKNNKRIINILTIILMTASIFVSIYKGYNAEGNENILYICLSLDCFFATFYAYNIVFNFFRILPLYYYLPVSIIGIVCVILCFVFPSCWGIFLGLEVFVIGVSLFCLRKTTIDNAKNNFVSKGFLYMFLGICIIILGIVYLIYNNENLVFYLIFHIFFVMYSLTCDWMHINYRFMINKIGLANTI